MKFLLTIGLWILPALLSAQTSPTWQDISGPQGFQTLLSGGGDTLFATNGRGVLNWSTDAGVSWSEILAYPSSTPLTNVSANGSHVVVALTYSASTLPYFIFTWNNSPNDWTRIFLSSFDFDNIVIDRAGIVFGIAFQSLQRHDSFGWYVVNQNLPFPTGGFFGRHIRNAVVIDDDDNFIVGADSVTSMGLPGVFISQDAGMTWYMALDNYAVTAVCGSLRGRIIAAASPNPNVNISGGVFLSADSGRSWRGLGLDNHQISSIVQDNSGKIFALADGNVYLFIDSTNTWEMKTNSVQPYQMLVAVPPTTILASGETAGMVRSVDEGHLWGGGEVRGKDVFAITETDSGDIVCGTLGGGIFRSVFGGTSWVIASGTDQCGYVYAFARGPGLIYAGTNCGVAVSTDMGLNWTMVSDSLFPGAAYALVRLGNGTLLAGTNFGIYRSTDGGVDWSAAGLASSKVYFMTATAGDMVLAATAGDGVYLSTDSGAHWLSKGLVRDDIQTVETTPSGKLMVGVYGGIFVSTDMGGSWQYRYVDDSYCYALENADSALVYAGTYHGVFLSSDDGYSWIPTTNIGLTQQFVLTLFQSQAGFSYAGTYRGGIYRSLQQTATALRLSVSPDRRLPERFSLGQNYPNPFNPSTEIEYAVPMREFVRLEIYNLLGEKIATLVDGQQQAGSYHVSWDASRRASGVYICLLRAGTFRESRKMLLIR